jgi:hypothetical protein
MPDITEPKWLTAMSTAVGCATLVLLVMYWMRLIPCDRFVSIVVVMNVLAIVGAVIWMMTDARSRAWLATPGPASL